MIWREFDGVVWMAPGTPPGIVLWIFLISGAVALIVWVVGLFRRTGAHASAERSLDSLKTRYAKGQIGREQYEEMKRELQS